jgi:hypothetical protein
MGRTSPQRFETIMDRFAKGLRRLNKRRRGKGGGSEAVTVEPDRPRQGEGGAAAALEYDDRP